MSVSWAVSSRTRAEPALWPPLTARNALVTAMAIFDGSKATTAPLRRMTLYCAKRGSALAASGELISPDSIVCVVVEDGVAEEGATCIDYSPVEISFLFDPPRLPLKMRSSSAGAAFRLPALQAPGAALGHFTEAFRKSLWNQNLLYLVFKCRLNTNHSR